MRMKRYRLAEDPFRDVRCFTNVDGTACLHLLVQHSDDACWWCGCLGFTALADSELAAGDAA